MLEPSLQIKDKEVTLYNMMNEKIIILFFIKKKTYLSLLL